MSSQHTQAVPTQKKRKRTKNTTTDQYEMYLTLLEEDYYIRSGTVNPSLGENYHLNKWTELCSKLNAVGEGPHLSVEEWKKRFTDWKYAVRAKYRKLCEHRKQTGSGPESEIKITAIEDRALSVWGKVVVTGTPRITDYDGILINNPEKPIDINQEEENNSNNNFNILDMEVHISNDQDNTIFKRMKNDSFIHEINSLVQPEVRSLVDTQLKSQEAPVEIGQKIGKNMNDVLEKLTYNAQRKNSVRTKPLTFLTEKLLETMTQSEQNSKELIETFKKYGDEFIKVQSEKNEVNALRLKFEIQKYQFENPLFSFNPKL